MKLNYSIWIETDQGEKFFGRGPYQLLTRVNKLGSVNKACKEMNMSYSKAMNIIKKCEKELKTQILHREIGGSSGGGSYLTEDGKELLEKFKELEDFISKRVEEINKEHFSQK